MAWFEFFSSCKMLCVSEAYFRGIQRTIAKNIRYHRQQSGLTQESAAQAMGIATRHLQKIESGEVNITIRTLCYIAKALAVRVSDLLSESRSKD